MSIEIVKKALKNFALEQPRFANKALDFYDGKQLTHVVDLLNTPNQGRRNWKERGMKAIYRNITRSIIDKSSMVFLKGRPSMEVMDLNGNAVDEETFKLNHFFDEAAFDNFLGNFDSVVRLLKTGLILTQYDNEFEVITFDILHRGNAYVETTGSKNIVETLCYLSEVTEDGKTYRVITPQTVSEYFISNRPSAEIVPKSIEDNNAEIVPIATFYDTNVPRHGYWNYIPQDLILFNEEYNLYQIDTYFAASFANNKALFTNANLSGDEFMAEDNDVRTVQGWNDKLPHQTTSPGKLIIGPDAIVEIDTTGVENPLLEYKGPDIKLQEINDMFQRMTKDIASDWSVRVKTDGEGTANSGFQVIVEEMDNLELRKQRQHNFQAGLLQLFGIIKQVTNSSEISNVFNEDNIIKIEFSAPSLPFEEDKEDKLWFERIDNGVASRINYIMFKDNISREEAEALLEQIDIDNKDFEMVESDDIDQPFE